MVQQPRLISRDVSGEFTRVYPKMVPFSIQPQIRFARKRLRNTVYHYEITGMRPVALICKIHRRDDACQFFMETRFYFPEPLAIPELLFLPDRISFTNVR